MPTKEELTERAQLVRIHEANCQLQFPTKDELNFRLAIMKQLGLAYNLRELRSKEISGPATQDTPKPGSKTATTNQRTK